MNECPPPCGHEHLAPSRAFALLDTGVLRMLEQPDAPPPVIVVPTELIVRGSRDVAKLVL